MIRYSSRAVRERAAVLCSMMACRTGDDLEDRFWFWPPCRDLGVDIESDAAELARLAFWNIQRAVPGSTPTEEMWAESESAIRDGWMPTHNRWDGAL